MSKLHALMLRKALIKSGKIDVTDLCSNAEFVEQAIVKGDDYYFSNFKLQRDKRRTRENYQWSSIYGELMEHAFQRALAVDEDVEHNDEEKTKNTTYDLSWKLKGTSSIIDFEAEIRLLEVKPMSPKGDYFFYKYESQYHSLVTNSERPNAYQHVLVGSLLFEGTNVLEAPLVLVKPRYVIDREVFVPSSGLFIKSRGIVIEQYPEARTVYMNEARARELLFDIT